MESPKDKRFGSRYDGDNFGLIIRAARLVYGWSEKHEAYIRITSEGPPFRIDIAPENNIPVGKKVNTKESYAAWWEMPEVLEKCPVLESLKYMKGVEEPFSFYVDNAGNAEKEHVPSKKFMKAKVSQVSN